MTDIVEKLRTFAAEWRDDMQPAIGEPLDEAADEIERLRAALRVTTDYLAELLEDEKFPGKGRSNDEKDAIRGWWDNRVSAVQSSYAVLAGVEHQTWELRYPGLYIPPPGPVKLEWYDR